RYWHGESPARHPNDVFDQIGFDRMSRRLWFHARDQQGSFRLEAPHLSCVAEPAPGVNLGSGGGVRNAAILNISKTRGAEVALPFCGRKQVRGNLEVRLPLMTVGILAVVIDQDPRGAAAREH